MWKCYDMFDKLKSWETTLQTSGPTAQKLKHIGENEDHRQCNFSSTTWTCWDKTFCFFSLLWLGSQGREYLMRTKLDATTKYQSRGVLLIKLCASLFPSLPNPRCLANQSSIWPRAKRGFEGEIEREGSWFPSSLCYSSPLRPCCPTTRGFQRSNICISPSKDPLDDLVWTFNFALLPQSCWKFVLYLSSLVGQHW